MTLLYIIIGCLVGVGVGFALPTISYTASNYLAIAIVAALDSVFGGIASSINKKFDLKVFISGFFVNAVLAMLLTFLGQKLNVDIYLAAIVVFVGRMFNNLGIIRRYYLEKIENHKKNNNTENASKTNSGNNSSNNEKNNGKDDIDVLQTKIENNKYIIDYVLENIYK